MTHQVFISYSSKDKVVADAVCGALEAHEIRCWIAPRDITVVDSYGGAIIDALNASCLLVLIFSSNSNNSPHVPNEVERAVSKRIPVIPFRIEEVLPSREQELFISRFHWLDAWTLPLEEHLERLVETVRRWLSSPGEGISARQLIVGTPPLDMSDTFKDRDDVLTHLRGLLADEKAKLISIVGRGGIGKTALLSKACEEIESGKLSLPGKLMSGMGADGIIYVNFPAGGRLTLDRLFEDVGQMLGSPCKEELEKCRRDMTRHLRDKISLLLAQLRSGSYLLSVDSFEDLLADDHTLADNDLQAFVDQCLETRNGLRLVVTTREDFVVSDHGFQRVRSVRVPGGLPEDEAIALLREHDPEGKLGLRTAPEPVLRELAKGCSGIPLALKKVAGILKSRKAHSPEALLSKPELFNEAVVQNLLEYQYAHLSDDERRVLQLLSFYDIPVPAEAVRALTEHLFPDMDVEGCLRSLEMSELVELVEYPDYSSEQEFCVLHPSDRRYACHRLGQEDWCDEPHLHAAAAAYFAAELTTYVDKGRAGTAYERFYRFENAVWQSMATEWLHHTALSHDRTRAHLLLAHVFFAAFWWWGDYIPFPFCDKILTRWAESQRLPEDEEFLGLLRQFLRCYPRKREWQERSGNPRWADTRQALMDLRRRLNCEATQRGAAHWLLSSLRRVSRRPNGNGESAEEDSDLRAVKAITALYLAESYQLTEDATDEAKRYYEEAIGLFAGHADYTWSESWALIELADLHRHRGQHGEVFRICSEAAKKIQDPDHEVRANLCRVKADTYWEQQDYSRAWQEYRRASKEAFHFQAEPHPPDLYTSSFYSEMVERIVARLRELLPRDPEGAIAAAVALHDFWRPYWETTGVAVPAASELQLREWIAHQDNEEASRKLEEYVCPLAPRSGDEEYAETVKAVVEKMSDLPSVQSPSERPDMPEP